MSVRFGINFQKRVFFIFSCKHEALSSPTISNEWIITKSSNGLRFAVDKLPYMKKQEAKKSQRWIIAQRWSHVLFISFRCDLDQIAQKVPSGLEVDIFDGSAWLSIVPFHMSCIRFPFTPVLPFSALWELNLRTYVTYRGRPGIYFLTLDTDSWLGQKIARSCFHLPYRLRKMIGQVDGHNSYSFESPNSFQIDADIGSEMEKSALDTWLVERYHLYTNSKSCLYRGDVLHDPWRLQNVSVNCLEDRFSSQFGFSLPEGVHTSYAASLNVKFRPFVKLETFISL